MMSILSSNSSNQRPRILIRKCHLAMWNYFVWSLLLICTATAVADEPAQDKEEEARREQVLKNMQRSAAQYTISSADTPQQAFKFHETPAIRSSNPIGDSKDGVLFLWTNHGRPQAILKLYTFNDKTYTHAWL